MFNIETARRPIISTVLRYGLAVLSVALALIVTLLLQPGGFITPMFFLAILLSAWFGGTGPGLLAALLATLAVDYFFLPPLYTLRFDPTHVPRLIVFFVMAVLVSSWSAARKRAETALRRARDEQEARVQERTADLRQANEQLRAEVAERRRVEETLRERADLLDLTHDSVFVRDMRDVITYWNRGAEELYGWTRDEAVGQVSHRLMQTAFPKPLAEINAELLSAGRWEGELIHTKRDGTQVVVASRWSLQRDGHGDPVAILETNNDISERRQAEEALQRSETYLAQAQRLSHTGSWAFNATGNFYWSEETFRIWGFDPQQGPPDRETVFQRVHPEDRDRVREQNVEAVCEGRDYRQEFRIVLPDGEVRHIQAVGHPVFSAGGDLVEIVGTHVDVTERKRAEEERQSHLWFLESMDRVNRAIQGTNDLEQMMGGVLGVVLSIFACDRAWLIYPCDPESPTWRAAMERTMPEFPGAFALGGDLPVDAEIANVFRLVRASSGAVRLGAGADTPVPAGVAERFSVQSQLCMAVYPKGDKPYMFGLHQCTHARVWTREEEALFEAIGRRLTDTLTSLLMFRNLRESEARLEEAQRIAHVGYWARDLDTDRLTWSDETHRIFGLPPQERTITFAGLQELIHSEDRQLVARAAAEALGGGARYDVEYRVVQPGGEVRIVHSQGKVTRDESGRLRRMFGTVQDITERRRAEEALQKAQAELAHISRVVTMGELTSSIAHEVNQPLAAIVTNANASLRWLAGQPPNLEEARECLHRIARDGNRASEVITRIRSLVRKSAPAREPLDPSEMIREVLAMTNAEARRRGVVARAELAAELPAVRGDRVQLQQVLLNLVLNGIEAMREVAGRPRELLIKSRPDASGEVRVSVQDSGVGLGEQGAERVFEAFYTTKAQGMGMGLAISRSIIEAHGGRLWASANDGHGATFQFTLPGELEAGERPAALPAQAVENSR